MKKVVKYLIVVLVIIVGIFTYRILTKSNNKSYAFAESSIETILGTYDNERNSCWLFVGNTLFKEDAVVGPNKIALAGVRYAKDTDYDIEYLTDEELQRYYNSISYIYCGLFEDNTPNWSRFDNDRGEYVFLTEEEIEGIKDNIIRYIDVEEAERTNPFDEGTLAYKIIENAKNATAEQIANLYAEYSPTPKTQPAAEVNGASESTLSVTEDDYGTSYYFRGNVANNYVNFAGMCWRIVRIESGGSVKLLLEDSTYECNNESYNGNWTIGNTIVFGYDSNGLADFLNNSKGRINYETGLAEELELYQEILLTKIRTHEDDNTKELSDYLKTDEWCYDYNITKYKYFGCDYEETDKDNACYTSKYYGASTRIDDIKQPSNICTGTKISKYGDNATDMYVGTLTADEIAFAGAVDNFTSTSNTNYYIMNTYAKNNHIKWWTFSPRYWNSEDHADYVYDVSYDGILRSKWVFNYTFISEDDYENYARPAISLKSNTIISEGDGTVDNPYVIN